MSDDGSPGLLAGITVIDLTTTFMGPYCTLLLAQFGARVIKVEPPLGDITRTIGDVTDSGLGPIFVNCNRGKESIRLDLTAQDDRQVLFRLLRTADVLAHNRPPGSIERLGLDYESLAELNQGLIHCGMYGYGAQGPYGKRPAYDDVIQAVSGVAANQTGSGEPQYVRTPMSDKVTGLMAAYAIASALFERTISGRGQAIEVPMFETTAQFLLMEQQSGHIFDPPRGAASYARTASPNRRPYRTADGLVSVMPYTDAHWRILFNLFDEGMLADPRFATVKARTANIDELYGWLSDQVASWNTAELLARLEELLVPSAPVASVESLFSDPHMAAVAFFEQENHPDLGPLRLPRNPVRFSRSSRASLTPARLLDQDGPALRLEAASPPAQYDAESWDASGT
jgi:crotonobetainyl-CoA:carnitine CoA-transferase CaiB-like acyl-CoA transferase